MTIAIVLVLLAGAVGFGTGYTVYGGGSDQQTTGVMDAAGRPVEIPESLDDGIVTVGVDALRFVSYFNLDEKVVMVDLRDKDAVQGGKAYQQAYGYNTNDNITSHSQNALYGQDVEDIENLGPSLVVVSRSVYASHEVNCEILSRVVPLVVIYELSEDSFMTDDYTLTDEFVSQIELLGMVLQKGDRAQELIEGINGFFAHIRGLVEDYNSTEAVYLAGTAVSGPKTLDWTVGNFASLELVGGINAYTESTSPVAVGLGPEKVNTLDFDIVFVDPTSYNMIEGSKDSTDVLAGFSDSGVDIHVMIPYFWFGCNFDNVIANAYYLAYVLYDGIYNQTAMLGYINDVYEFFYGEDGAEVFTKMDAFFTNATVSLPLLTQVEVVGTGDDRTLSVVP